jgi:hypothetical protein
LIQEKLVEKVKRKIEKIEEIGNVENDMKS